MENHLSDLIDKIVVLDLDAPQAYVGVLKAILPQWIILEQVIIYDPHSVQIGYEQFLVELRQHHQLPSRDKVYVNTHRVIGITPLDAVMLP
ncbi:MAG: hypothetical protein D6820_16945 [Lentisphaerae bacterium]|nr:MAG: hypothetical protein D6820_16945 [Lentisphaerota bacterium]